VILFLHNRYRTRGGEERAVEELVRLVREDLREDAEVLERDSAGLGRAAAAAALMRGGMRPRDVAEAVRLTHARVVHAHNLNPAFGPRALEAARGAGARVVLHLHNYRLVCAVGTCIDSAGRDCTDCQGANTLPGVRKNCRGSRPEAAAYAAGLALHARRLTAAADAIVVPSAAALGRLRELRAPIDDVPVHVIGHVVREFASASRAAKGEHALVVSRLAREKDVGVAAQAAELAGIPLVVAGSGPLERELRAAYPRVDFRGHVEGAELADLRARARVALVPTRAAETFGLSALEAMAAGVPVVATRVGALAELEGGAELVEPGDPEAMAAAATRIAGNEEIGNRAIVMARQRCAPEIVAPRLAAVYA
jgi:glycosyltransferase involved in cell wall biosynthesis